MNRQGTYHLGKTTVGRFACSAKHTASLNVLKLMAALALFRMRFASVLLRKLKYISHKNSSELKRFLKSLNIDDYGHSIEFQNKAIDAFHNMIPGDDETQAIYEAVSAVSAQTIIPAEILLFNICSEKKNDREQARELIRSAAMTVMANYYAQIVYLGYFLKHQCDNLCKQLDGAFEGKELEGEFVNEVERYYVEFERAEIIFKEISESMTFHSNNLLKYYSGYIPEARYLISTMCHDLKNKIMILIAESLAIPDNLKLLLASWDQRQARKIHGDINRLFIKTVENLHLIPFTNEDLRFYINRRFPNVSVDARGRLPDWVYNHMRIINGMVTHFILNAQQHSFDEGGVRVKVRINPQWISVEDSGRGIISEQLLELSGKVKRASQLNSKVLSHSGCGIRDSVMLLKVLSHVLGPVDRETNVKLTIASKVAEGTKIFISWGDFNLNEHVAEDWCRVEFLGESRRTLVSNNDNIVLNPMSELSMMFRLISALSTRGNLT